MSIILGLISLLGFSRIVADAILWLRHGRRPRLHRPRLERLLAPPEPPTRREVVHQHDASCPAWCRPVPLPCCLGCGEARTVVEDMNREYVVHAGSLAEDCRDHHMWRRAQLPRNRRPLPIPTAIPGDGMPRSG